MALNVGEEGNLLRFNVQQDISGAQNTLRLRKPDGVELIDLPVIVGSSDVTTDDGQEFLADQYIEYTWPADQLDLAGCWHAKVRSQWGGKVLYTDWTEFPVKL